MFKIPRMLRIYIITQSAIISVALAQPQMVNVGIGISDMTADGQTVVGVVYDRPIQEYGVARYTRGIGTTQILGAVVGGNGKLSCSDDAAALALEMDNIDDWGDLNCFDSNYDPPYAEPCPYIPSIAHHWTSNTGWVNCGSFPTNEVVQSYTCGSDAPADYLVRVGGTRCDFTINTPYDISGDGRYVVGAGWFQTGDPRDDGCPPFGFCGDFLSFRWDSMTGVLETLPVLPGSDTARADRTNYDGSVIVGYDLSIAIDPDGPGPIEVEPNQPIRKLVAWRNGVEMVLDGYGHRGSPPVNSDGTMIASQTSEIETELLFGPAPATPEDQLFYTRLVRWTWDGASYVAESLGKPALYMGFPAIQMIVTDISDDGDTIVGSVGYGTQDFAPTLTWRLFIWRSTLNGGVPMDLQEYLRSQMPMGDTTFDEDVIWLSDVRNLSADGNAMVVNYLKWDDADSCLPTFNNAILYLNGTTCEPPMVELDDYAIARVEPTVLQSDVINCRASGTWPLDFQWQKRDLATGNWVDLVDSFDPDCILGFGEYLFQGTTTAQLRIGIDPFYVSPCDAGSGDYRCVVTNSCGSATTDVCHVTVGPEASGGLCFFLGDMNDDFQVNANDIPNFVASILGKPFPDSVPVDRADMNLDARKDGQDIQEFIQAIFP